MSELPNALCRWVTVGTVNDETVARTRAAEGRVEALTAALALLADQYERFINDHRRTMPAIQANQLDAARRALGVPVVPQEEGTK